MLILAKAAHPDACVERQVIPADLIGFGEGTVDVLRESLGLDGPMAGRIERGELVPANASELDALGFVNAQAVGERPEQGIADRVANRVVDLGEALEIDQQSVEIALRSLCLGDRLFSERREEGPVGQIGQQVVARHAAARVWRRRRRGLRGRLLLVSLTHDLGHADDLAARSGNRVCRQDHVDGLTALVPQLSPVLGDFLTAKGAREDGLHLGRAVRRCERGSRTPNSLDGEMAKHLFGRRVPARDNALGGGGDDRAVRNLEQYREEVLAWSGLLALSHRLRLTLRRHSTGLARNY